MPKPNAVITESSPSLAEARVTLMRLETEAAELRRVVTGTTSVETVRRERHGIIGRTGRAESIEVDVPHIESRPVGAVEQSQARRRLRELEETDLPLAAEAVEVATAAAAVAARQARDALVAEGTAMMRADLPRLLRETRRVQREWQQFQARCEALDQRLGERRFTEAAWPFVMAPGAQFDAFVAACRASYGVDLGA